MLQSVKTHQEAIQQAVRQTRLPDDRHLFTAPLLQHRVGNKFMSSFLTETTRVLGDLRESWQIAFFRVEKQIYVMVDFILHLSVS